MVDQVAESRLNVVTGAFGYIGRRIARQLLQTGQRVRTITTHPEKPNPFPQQVEAFHYDFNRPDDLIRHLEGARVLFNTYWIRFEHDGQTFEQALENTRVLFDCARRAGVKRIVHISVTRAAVGDPLPYYDGKARQEQALRQSGVPYAILRPTLVFGRGDILVNNIAWLLRRFPLFPIFGSGDYRVQPIYIGDLARLCRHAADRTENLEWDAAGPETLTYKQLVRATAQAIGARSLLIHLPARIGLALGRLVGLVVGDVILTKQELRGLMQEKLTTDEAPRGELRFTAWANENSTRLGRSYASEIERHFDWSPPGN